ncbi:MAG: hypothetical protein LUO93_10785 [Methanomicrobiales archaeon]|nr:hypothetical protein [Methanomicrobiales archaeon]
MTDHTFTSIAGRAALYLVIMRRGQIPPLKVKKEISHSAEDSGSLGWLLLNTREVNRVLVHACSRKD